MNIFKNNWKAFLAAGLTLAAVLVFFLGYRPQKEAFVRQREILQNQIDTLETTIRENEKYRDVQELLGPAREALEKSRTDLYARFPQELREEDQLLYLIYLEKTLGRDGSQLGYTQKLHDIWADRLDADILFNFGQVTPLNILSDGSTLAGLNMEVFYRAPYQDFKRLVNALARDDRVASIRFATFESPDPADLHDGDGFLNGRLSLILYVLDARGREYREPDIRTPAVGKSDPFRTSGTAAGRTAQPAPRQPAPRQPAAGTGGVPWVIFD